MYLPACRIIQIGGRSTSSPRIARSMSGSTSPLEARAHGARRTARGRRAAASGFWSRARRTTSRARASATSASVEARAVDIALVCARRRWIRGWGDVCGRGTDGEGDVVDNERFSREIFGDARSDGRAVSYDCCVKLLQEWCALYAAVAAPHWIQAGVPSSSSSCSGSASAPSSAKDSSRASAEYASDFDACFLDL